MKAMLLIAQADVSRKHLIRARFSCMHTPEATVQLQVDMFTAADWKAECSVNTFLQIIVQE